MQYFELAALCGLRVILTLSLTSPHSLSARRAADIGDQLFDLTAATRAERVKLVIDFMSRTNLSKWEKYMRKAVIFTAIFLAAGSAPAMAQNCAAYTYTFTNGTTADAGQVMSNFNTIRTCGNSQLLGKTNNLSDVQSAPTARTNLGLGTGSTVNITASNSPPSGTANTGDIWIQW